MLTNVCAVHEDRILKMWKRRRREGWKERSVGGKKGRRDKRQRSKGMEGERIKVRGKEVLRKGSSGQEDDKGKELERGRGGGG